LPRAPARRNRFSHRRAHGGTGRGVVLLNGSVRNSTATSRTLVGIDHAFSFPLAYFERYRLSSDWPTFLVDFRRHWPTDDPGNFIDFIRDGGAGNGMNRMGDSSWLRLTERWTATAKSVFLFDVQGAVAKSTHAGLPLLLYLRKQEAVQGTASFLAVRRLGGSSRQISSGRGLPLTVDETVPKRRPRWGRASCLCRGGMAATSRP